MRLGQLACCNERGSELSTYTQYGVRRECVQFGVVALDAHKLLPIIGAITFLNLIIGVEHLN